MLAFSLSLGIFLAVSLLGLILIPQSVSKLDKSLGIFLAPVLGLSTLVVVVFSLSRLGIPLANVGLPIFISLILLIVIRRKNISYKLITRSHTLKFLLLPFGVLLAAWPILKYGFSWISYVNDDMNNYVLATTRFLNYGFFSEPDNLYYRGMDYSQLYYYMHVDSHVRSGSEMFLAIVSSVTHLEPIKIFMPTILALQMILISSILALSRLSKYRSKRLTRISYILSIGSGMLSLGFLYQLIAQVGGLAIGIGFICLLIVYLKTGGSYRDKWPTIMVAVSILCAALIWYPEFLGFVAIICLIILVTNRNIINKKDVYPALTLIVLTIIVLNQYFFQAVKFGIFQFDKAQESVAGVNSNAQLFPYFLNPHGLSAYLGLSPLNRWYSDPFESLAVVSSMLFLSGIVMFILRKAQDISPSSIATLTLIVGFSYLVFTANGFGAFKIAMFVAPFLVVVIAEVFQFSLVKPFKVTSAIVLSCLLVLTSLNIRTSQFYSAASTGTSSNGFNEIQNGSGTNFTDMIDLALDRASRYDNDLISTSVNLSQIKLEAIAAKETPVFFSSTNPFDNVYNSSPLKEKVGYKKVIYNSVWGANTFYQPNLMIDGAKNFSYLVSRNKYEVLNHSGYKTGSGDWSYEVVSKPRNYVAFINSTMGPSYYENKDRKKTVFFQPEKNPMIPGRYMQSIGNDLLIQVIGLSTNPVLIMNVSTTVMSQYNRKIPKIFIQGELTQEVTNAGRGSAQIEVSLGKPMVMNGFNYYHIHIDQALEPFPQKKSIIGKLYGTKFEQDARRVGLFLNNLSIVDQSEINRRNSQNAISIFPQDLALNNTEYSGIYEDGWIGNNSSFTLSDVGKTQLEIAGSVPILENNPRFKTSITLSVDGKIYTKKYLLGGPFKISVPWTTGISSPSLRKVSISFSNEQKLRVPDGRPASAQILFVGFK